MAWIPAAIGIAGELLGAATSADSAHRANRTNIKLSREQRAWEEKMANSAVQRRADDVEKAGFNRLLAATGPGASTPSVSAPTVNPTFDPNFLRGTTAAAVMQQEQLRNLRANTENSEQQARIRKVEANIAEDTEGQVAEFKSSSAIQGIEWNKAKTKIMESQVTRTAAEAEKMQKTVDAVVQVAQQQAEKGKLELDQIKSVIESFGLGAQDKATLMKSIMQIIIPLFKD